MTKISMYNQEVFPFEDLDLRNLCGRYWTIPVSYWPPTNKEIKLIVGIATEVSKKSPLILDLGCGSGFLSYLMALEGNTQVVGISPQKELIDKSPYKHENLEIVEGTSETAVERYSNQNVDVVFCSWMAEGIDLTPDIHRINPKVIVYVRDKDRFTGTRDSFALGEDYRMLTKWNGIVAHEVGWYYLQLRGKIDPGCYKSETECEQDPRWKKLFQEGLSSLSPYSSIRYANQNIVEIQIRNDVVDPILPLQLNNLTKYNWESDLEHLLDSTERVFSDKQYGPPIVLGR